MPGRWHLTDATVTEQVGAAIASSLVGGMVVGLHGDLGTGKTTLVRGVLRGLGFSGPVKSPTYTLVESYPFSSLYLYHFDFYRFADPSEWETAGLAEYFRSDSACLVEWPERVAALLPIPDLDIELAHPARNRSGRDLSASSTTEAGKRCLEKIARLALPASP
jgi:tRNA threonylcarbamoyladenosine biosynthesis protein TsaE